MRERRLFYRFFFLHFICLFLLSLPVYSQNTNSGLLPGKHRGAVTALIRNGNGNFISGGEDGFIGIWNNQAAIDRFQVSTSGVKSLAQRPRKPHIAAATGDGFSAHSLSLWNYETRKNIFTLNLADPVSFMNFSAAGSFLIVCLSGHTGIILIDAETGGIYESPEDLTNSVNFAATSLSEKVIITYSPEGILSYWNLETGAEIQRHDVSPNIRSPVLFGNNCFLGGFDSSGLVILDTVSGSTLARDRTINGSIFIENPNTTDSQGRALFYCLSSENTINTMEIYSSGRLTSLSRTPVPREVSGAVCAAPGGGNVFTLGNDKGEVWHWNRNLVKLLDSSEPHLITDFAASSEALGFITESGAAGYLPLDYTRLRSGGELRLEDVSAPDGTGAYTRISSGVSPGKTGNSNFIFWQNSRVIPMQKTLQGQPLRAEGEKVFLNKLPLRFPIRSALVYDGKILFLNTQGELSVLNQETGNLQFSYNAAGAQDAAFISNESILVGRNAVTGNTPFLLVYMGTGETVPLPYPAISGLKVYLDSGGTVYGAVVSRVAGEILTSILRFNIQNPSVSDKIAEYSGEDSSFFLSESGGNPVFNLGGGAAEIYSNRNKAKLSVERTRGLPQKAADGGGKIIILDGDGSISWHDRDTGKLLAIFNIYASHWTLTSNGVVTRGTLIK